MSNNPLHLTTHIPRPTDYTLALSRADVLRLLHEAASRRFRAFRAALARLRALRLAVAWRAVAAVRAMVGIARGIPMWVRFSNKGRDTSIDTSGRSLAATGRNARKSDGDKHSSQRRGGRVAA